jgi:Ca-activated chloride channel family protein
MARGGDGNYYYIEGPKQLPDIFQAELKGLMAAFGDTVSLGIEPQDGVAVADVLNDPDRLPSGLPKLPNLVAGMPIIVEVRLNVPPTAQEGLVCRFRLAWNDPGQGERREATAPLSLPVTGAAWESLAPSTEVQERAALLLIARAKKAATRCLERGDREGALRCLTEARAILAGAPDTPEMRREAQALTEVEAYVESGESMKFLKHAKYRAHQRRRSQPYRDA